MTDFNRKGIMKFILSHKEINMPNETMYKLLEYFEAMAHFYALIPLQKVYEILTVNYNENVSEEEFYELTDALHKDPIGHYYIDSHDEVYNQSKTGLPQERQLVHESIVAVDIDIYKKIHTLKKNKPYYVPKKEEMLKYFDDLYYEETEQLINMRRFFIKKLTGDYEKALDIVDEIALHITSESDSIDDALNDIQRMGYDMSLEETREFVTYYEELRNNSRMPANNGYTPLEMEAILKERGIKGNSMLVKDIKIEEKHEAKRHKNSADMSRTFDAMANILKLKMAEEGVMLPMMKKPKAAKIGRNDLCPCGSGKKFKKCCGR